MSDTLHAIFHVIEVDEYQQGSTVNLMASVEESDDNKALWAGTPDGLITIQVTNMDAVAQFKPGQVFSVDFTPMDVSDEGDETPPEEPVMPPAGTPDAGLPTS